MWVAGWLVCRICVHKWVGVRPESRDCYDNQECPNCGNMTGDEPDATN